MADFTAPSQEALTPNSLARADPLPQAPAAAEPAVETDSLAGNGSGGTLFAHLTLSRRVNTIHAGYFQGIVHDARGVTQKQ